MTDEMRKRLCKVLRTTTFWSDTTDLLLEMAADEIERLAARIRELENSGLDNRPLTAAPAYDASKIKTHQI